MASFTEFEREADIGFIFRVSGPRKKHTNTVNHYYYYFYYYYHYLHDIIIKDIIITN